MNIKFCLKNWKPRERTRRWRSRWGWSISLFTDVSGIHLHTELHAEHQLRADRGKWPEKKNIYNHAKLSTTKELGGKTGVLAGLHQPSAGGELKQQSDSQIGAIVWVRGETFKVGSETADLWQPKWNKNQTVLVAVIHTPERDPVGMVEWSQG